MSHFLVIFFYSAVDSNMRRLQKSLSYNQSRSTIWGFFSLVSQNNTLFWICLFLKTKRHFKMGFAVLIFCQSYLNVQPSYVKSLYFTFLVTCRQEVLFPDSPPLPPSHDVRSRAGKSRVEIMTKEGLLNEVKTDIMHWQKVWLGSLYLVIHVDLTKETYSYSVNRGFRYFFIQTHTVIQLSVKVCFAIICQNSTHSPVSSSK